MAEIPITEFVKLQKLMGMTTAANDYEALAAIRKANELLKRHGIGWPEVFKRTVTVEMVDNIPADPPKPNGTTRSKPRDPYSDRATSTDQADDINEAFQILIDTVKPGGFRDTVLSIHRQWKDKHWLSDDQRRVIFDGAARANGRR